MDKQFNRIENTTTLIVNSYKIDAPGVGNANEGFLSSRIVHNFPFAVEILAPMAIVGYPTYSEYKEFAHDLFKPSTLRGGYKYQRAYRFSNGARFSSYHNIEYDAAKNRLHGVFSTVNFPEEKFRGDWRVQDLLEIFIPHTPGMIKSVMAVEWRDDGQRLHAIIESEYYFNHNETLPGLHSRHVKFANEHQPGEYIQSEKITVQSVGHFDFGTPVNMFLSGGTQNSAP
ncbi:hypothetical protein [Burkholderia pseudomallei]|uniref:hypothetical protein n=1 Tax=Burkholderia pseudomallei TaxID=28450 RepID=UPI0005381B41|nr:hypothetical protein [Burkholderia pseudomallei]KGW10846.1 green fluorescent family protein [Burkholderia pseudomallei MSHR4303]KKB68170.1 green fluorescent family protein [Burkholderia pseudomallei MSHR1079]CAK0005613.1 Green fluorescent protein [Burkholderia pseudomallei]